MKGGRKSRRIEGDCITPPPPSPTVVHGICLLAQLHNCVPAKWPEGSVQRLGCRWAGSGDRQTDSKKTEKEDRDTQVALKWRQLDDHMLVLGHQL